MWVDYLTSDDALYPDWIKYWAVRSVLSMSTYDKEKHEFGVRTDSTVAPFPDLNREALAYAVDVIEKLHSPELLQAEERIRQQRNTLKKAKSALRQNPDDVHAQEAFEQATAALADLEAERKSLIPNNPVEEGQNEFAEERKLVSDEDFEHILSTENFAKYYAFAIEHVVADNSELFKITEGEWRVFEQGSDAQALTSTIQGHGTGWCTAGESTAASQLGMGDFYVYYSKNELGEAKIPRLAIRMEGDQIVEVRGVAHQQEIDPYIAPVLEEKMDEFGEQGEVYKKKAENMKLLTRIERKHDTEEVLNTEELRFLYELDSRIEGFGYQRDPRISELRSKRSFVEDMSIVYGTKDQGSLLLKLCEEANLRNEHDIDSAVKTLNNKISDADFSDIDISIAHKLIADGFVQIVADHIDWFSMNNQEAQRLCVEMCTAIKYQAEEEDEHDDLDRRSLNRNVTEIVAKSKFSDLDVSVAKKLFRLQLGPVVAKHIEWFAVSQRQDVINLAFDDHKDTRYAVLSEFKPCEGVNNDTVVQTFLAIPPDPQYPSLGGYEASVAAYLKNFTGLSALTAQQLIERGQAFSVGTHLDSFESVDQNDVLEAIFETEWAKKRGSATTKIQEMLQKWEKFDGRTSDILISNYFSHILVSNLNKLEGITKLELADKLMNNAHACKSIPGHLDEFEGLDHSKLVDAILSFPVSSGNTTHIPRHLEKFEGVDHVVLADRLLQAGDTWGVAENIAKFKGVDQTTIAKKIIAMGDGQYVAKYIDQFDEVDQNKMAQLLLQAGEAADVLRAVNNGKFTDLRNIDKGMAFNWLTESWCRHYVPKHIDIFKPEDRDEILARYESSKGY